VGHLYLHDCVSPRCVTPRLFMPKLGPVYIIKQDCLSVEGRPPQTYFASVTLTLKRCLSYTNLTWKFWRCTCLPKINFLGQGFHKLEH